MAGEVHGWEVSGTARGAHWAAAVLLAVRVVLCCVNAVERFNFDSCLRLPHKG